MISFNLISPIFKAGFTLCLLIGSVSGCSLAGFAPEVDRTTTTATTKTYNKDFPLQETVDPSDWDKVREVMASVLVSRLPGEPVQWENNITGTIGTITPLAVLPRDNGAFCRRFSTTMNGVGGVLQYRGDACKKLDGEIQLIDLVPHTSVVEAIPLPNKNLQ